jgi:hypothetical protein
MSKMIPLRHNSLDDNHVLMAVFQAVGVHQLHYVPEVVWVGEGLNL